MECGCLVSVFPNNAQLSNQKTLDKNFNKQEYNSESLKRTTYKNSSHVVHVLEELDSLRKDEVLCDIILETDDGTLVYGHKVVLASATPYFQAMFTSFEESNKSRVILQKLDSTAVKLLVDFIYTGQIMVSEDNVQVFECVIKWVNHDLSNRKDDFPKLMEHVHLPLVSKEYLYNIVREEPLVKSSLECRDYLVDALYLHLLKSEKPDIICTKPRQPDSFQKVILIVGKEKNMNGLQWFDPSTKRWQRSPEINVPIINATLTVLNDQLLFFLQNNRQVYMLDLFSQSPCCKESVPMLKKRSSPGVGVLDNCIYVIGGDDQIFSTSGEVFNFRTQKWQMISVMSTARKRCGVGFLNDHLYAVGGFWDNLLKSVERYCPRTDTWIPVADLNEARCNAGVGVLNGVLYAIGGYTGLTYLNCVEAYNPSSNTWTFVSNMHKNRSQAGVVALNGLLYVLSKENGSHIYSAEMYDPKSNIWTLLSGMDFFNCFPGAVVINKPPFFST